MSVSRTEVDKVAALACLNLSAAEAESMTHELTRILGHVEKFRDLNLGDIAATAQVIELATVFRPDETRPCLARDEALYNAPESAAGLFVVPKVMKDR